MEEVIKCCAHGVLVSSSANWCVDRQSVCVCVFLGGEEGEGVHVSVRTCRCE